MSESPQYALAASVNALATCLTLPFDYTKVHQQIAASGHKVDIVRGLPIARQAVSRGGLNKIYIGADAAAFRAIIYSTTRLSIYFPLI